MTERIIITEEEKNKLTSTLKQFIDKNTENSFNKVNHPPHYAKGRKYEPIDVIEDWGLGFSLGNALKYISRAGRKDNFIQDLEKAKWYLDREIQRLKKDKPS